MGYLILGFILGVAVSWFWQVQFSGVPAFQRIMQKELAVNGQLGSVAALKKRLEMMEKQLAEMEKTAKGQETIEQQRPDLQVPQSLTGESAVVRPLRPQGATKAVNREKVITLWKAGKPVSEIASQSSLGKGEVELIIAMYDRLKSKEL